jgi:hypothetical protein
MKERIFDKRILSQIEKGKDKKEQLGRVRAISAQSTLSMAELIMKKEK